MKIKELYEIYTEFPSVSTDTRKDPKDSIFFCLTGENFDANTFAEEALKKGAVLVVTTRKDLEGNPKISAVKNVLETLQNLAAYHRSTFDFPVIGLTGSNGKTTNKELLAAILSKKYKTAATRGNLNNHIGVPLTLLEIPTDTQVAIVEMGANHRGEIADLCKIVKPNFGIITNIGKAHLEGFGGEEGVKLGKKELYDFIEVSGGQLFVNGDDAVLTELSAHIPRILYGQKNPNTSLMGRILPDSEGGYLHLEFKISEEKDWHRLHSQLIGSYNFPNMLTALAVGAFFNVPHSEMVAAIEAYTPSNSRSQLIHTSQNKVILDAYNANPTSVKAALENFARLPDSNKIAMLGQMHELGEHANAEHQGILDLLREMNLKAFLVGPLFPKSIQCANMHYFADMEALKTYLTENPVTGYTILLKGSRTMQMEKALEVL